MMFPDLTPGSVSSPGQLNSGNLAGNQFVNFSLLALTEMPACFLGQFFVDRLGRRWSHVMCHTVFTLMMASIMVVIAVEGQIGPAVTGLAVTARVFSNIAWYVMWIQAMEVLPTDTRGTTTNICSLLANLANLSSPYIVLLVNNLAPFFSSYFFFSTFFHF